LFCISLLKKKSEEANEAIDRIGFNGAYGDNDSTFDACKLINDYF
jgi:hypothetical protein